MSDTPDPYRILVVCTGNICRSPMGEVVLRDRLARAGLDGRVEVASAAVSAGEEGNPIDRRARSVLVEHGYEIHDHRAHQVAPGELEGYDLVLAMTEQHARALRRRAATDGLDGETARRIRLWREFDAAPGAGGSAVGTDLDVPDPWYGDYAGFYDTLDVVERGADGVLTHVREALGRQGDTPAHGRRTAPTPRR